MEIEDIEVEDRFSVRPSRMSQAFPGFKIKSVTFFVTVVQIVMYGISLLIEKQEIINPTPQALLKLGANSMYQVLEEKEIWRLFTSLFLHGNFMHLLVIHKKINIFSQLRLCFAMEKYFKSLKFILIYTLSGLGGNLLAGYFYPYSILVGSSTALFGIFGSFACYFIYNWHILGPGRNLNLIIYLFFVIISLELPITLDSVDIAGHIGGFILGILLGFFLLPREERSETWDFVLLINGIGSLAYFVILIWLLSTLRFD